MGMLVNKNVIYPTSHMGEETMGKLRGKKGEEYISYSSACHDKILNMEQLKEEGAYLAHSLR